MAREFDKDKVVKKTIQESRRYNIIKDGKGAPFWQVPERSFLLLKILLKIFI